MKKHTPNIFLCFVCGIFVISTAIFAKPGIITVAADDNNEIVASVPPPLFEAYTGLTVLPYVSLGNLQETPVYPVREFDIQGAKFYLKDDGVLGTDKNGYKIFSGNKRRKLEFLLPYALKYNATRVYTVGAAGSNHATATAAYARELGLASTLILGPQRNTRYTQRNLMLDLYYGADFVVCKTREDRQREYKERSENKQPGEYFIPVGGSNEIGATGFVNAAFELKKQIASGLMPEPDVIYITISSVGTAAGLIVGCRAAQLRTIIRVVCIDDTSYSEIAKDLTDLVYSTSKYLNGYDETFPVVSVEPTPDGLARINVEIIRDNGEITGGVDRIRDDHAKNPRHSNHSSYALNTEESASAIRTFFGATKIRLDGTYAGKAFATCLQELITGKLSGKTVMFWNTFFHDPLDEYTKSVDPKNLPKELQKYVFEAEGYPIQEYDICLDPIQEYNVEL